MNREAIFAALYALGSVVEWDSPPRTFKTISRRVQHFSKCADQPAFFQVERDEKIEQITGMPYKTRLEAVWMVYQNTGKDPKAVPATENNLILDALQAVVSPKFVAGEQYVDRCTLGGLVYDCKISGTITKYDGALENQGIVVVPLEILVP
jgi:hypothetical protein